MGINFSSMDSESNDYNNASMTKALLFVLGTYLLILFSIALTVLIGVGFVALIYYLFSTFTNRIPIKLIVLPILGVGVGILSMLKGILYSLRPKQTFHPAIISEKEKQSKLIRFITDLCKSMDTKVPDYILLHSEPTFFVQQGKALTFNGAVKGRILAIGMPLLSYLNENELRAILAHEFAHFTGKDTVYSSYILPVYESTITAITNMEAYENNNNGLLLLPMILPIVILKAYYNKFNLSNMKRSREREKRADLIACQCCGSEDFKNALTKVISIAGIFADNAQNQILETHKEGKVYVNYYEYFRDCKESVKELSESYKNVALKEKTNKYSSHPSFSDRLKYIPYVGPKYSTKESSVNLINDVEEYEKLLTSTYTEYVTIINGVVNQ